MEKRSLFCRRAEGEDEVLSKVRVDEAWGVVERFNSLYRHSSERDETIAAEFLCERLKKLGVPFKRHDAKLYLSLPREAKLSAGGREYRAKTPSFSKSTWPANVAAPLVYVPEESPGGFKVSAGFRAKVAGRIVLTEWPPAGELVVEQLAAAGVAGTVFAHPGERIHEDTCGPIWGSPERSSMHRIPAIPVIHVNRVDGDSLIAALGREPDLAATLVTRLDAGWKHTSLVVAEVPGSVWPDEFVLLHGHLDAWHVGVGDNAVGNGALLEIARVLWGERQDLKRSLRLAWWTGHSTGRYAGSTWFADLYALDLVENCIAQVNCDSPGCRWATDLTGVPAMAELAEFTAQAVFDLSGQHANPDRPGRAGDYSFNNLGIPGAMMLSSKIPDEVKDAKGLYGVGGCGGNVEWHTEADTIEIADKDILLRDMKLYALIAWRLANLPVHPIDCGATAREISRFARGYQEQCGDRFDVTPVALEAERLASQLAGFYGSLADSAEALEAPSLQRVNALQRRISRCLVEVDYSREGRFHYDPAQPVPPVPDLAWANELADLDPGSDLFGFTQTSLQRGRNRVVYALREAQRLLGGFNL